MLSADPVIGSLGWVVLALGSALLGGSRQRRLGAAGLVSLGLGLAAWRAGESAGSRPEEAGFLVVNGGLTLLGLALLLGAAATDVRRPSRPAARLAIALGAALVLRMTAGQLVAAGLVRATSAAVVLGLVGAGLVRLGRLVASIRPVRVAGRRLFGAPIRPGLPPGDVWRSLAVIAAGAVAAAAGPHVAVVFAGVVVAACAGYLAIHLRAPRPLPVAPALTLTLAPACWLVATIAGPIGLGTGQLAAVPMSPAAESLVAGALLLAGWSAAGLWPLHRQLPGAIVGVVGAVMLARVALPLAPGGMDQWRPLVVPVLVVGMWHAAAHGRWPLLAAGGGLLGIVSPAGAGVVGGWYLLGTALVLEVGRIFAMPRRFARVVEVAGWISAAWGGVLVLEGALRGEVVYTAVGAAGIAVGVLAAGNDALVDSAPGRAHIWPDQTS
jgi:hypothetical protein